MAGGERGTTGGRHAVILCHPDPSSFNHAIAGAYCDAVRGAGQGVVLRDLYAMGFDPVLKAAERPTNVGAVYEADVLAEVDAIAGCDVFVLVYPIWFGTPPAMLKGYVERVFGAGVQPEALQGRVRTDLLGGKRLVSFSTSAASKVWLDEQGQGQGLNSVFDQYLVHAFGMRSQEHRRYAHIVPGLSARFADQYLREVAAQAQRTCAQIAFGDEALLADPALVARMAR
ncbi:NAD(P)H dehydrogenase (quinone) [Sphingomonas sp. PP-CE-3A-406]|uniref:NAD(P)H-dependent oxidoreductase n=1 Tax=Sphingomonas sp. PP-CE-3A-406 TaxID=2135659 RepID=UPI000EF97D58|nr:NAD(P)H-dependent oxidoreductase [Sphingomonas sp. PP-CE-3A-406]RMB56007.1 NAD(P)H dehydrogenase (quinone) [Sphingomonas sp. PP-CE-3A-406]